jgi:cytochrome c biogenesis protein CcmG/thiol:disulfide interchange protein DsbE
LDYKDKREDALSLLNEMGNPYVLCASDADGRVAIDYGVYGVPETYVIDREGVIRFKQVGPLTPEAIQNTVLPLVKDLSK